MAKKQPVNSFDAIATHATSKSKSSNNFPVAETTDEVQKAVEDVLDIKSRMDVLKVELSAAEELIITSVREQQDELARQGNYSKSFTVPGYDSTLTYTTSDKFSDVTDLIVLDHLKDLLKGLFDKFFQSVRSIALKKEVVEDPNALKKLTEAFTKAGLNIADYFTVTDATRPVKGLDLLQYELNDKDLADFRTMVKQAKASLK